MLADKSAKKEGTARPLFFGMKSISTANIRHWTGESKLVLETAPGNTLEISQSRHEISSTLITLQPNSFILHLTHEKTTTISTAAAVIDNRRLGTNNWIVKTPNDNNRTSLYLAPASQWTKATRFDANGDVAFSSEARVSIGNVACASGVSCTGRLGINNLSLAVDGKIGAHYGIHVVNVGVAWPDYVFAPAYTLSPLTEVAAFIEANHHLPDLPSAAEVQAEGVELVSMQAALLRKVEELTLHLIQLEKDNRALQLRVQQLEN